MIYTVMALFVLVIVHCSLSYFVHFINFILFCTGEYSSNLFKVMNVDLWLGKASSLLKISPLAQFQMTCMQARNSHLQYVQWYCPFLRVCLLCSPTSQILHQNSIHKDPFELAASYYLLVKISQAVVFFFFFFCFTDFSDQSWIAAPHCDEIEPEDSKLYSVLNIWCLNNNLLNQRDL